MSSSALPVPQHNYVMSLAILVRRAGSRLVELIALGGPRNPMAAGGDLIPDVAVFFANLIPRVDLVHAGAPAALRRRSARPGGTEEGPQQGRGRPCPRHR